MFIILHENILIQNAAFLVFTLHITILALFSHYLAMKYLDNPFKRNIIMYLIWCSIQCILIGFCSTEYTRNFIVLILPIIGLTSWVLLLRATSLLSRVLRSQQADANLDYSSRKFCNTQLSAYNFFRIMRIVLLITSFFLILVEIIYFCQVQIGQTMVIPLFNENTGELLRKIVLSFDAFFFIVYGVSLIIYLYTV